MYQPSRIPPDLVFRNVEFPYKPAFQVKNGRRYPAPLGRIAIITRDDVHTYKLFKADEKPTLRTSVVLIDGRYLPLISELAELNFEVNLCWNIKFIMTGDEIDYALARMVNADFMFLLQKKLLGQPLYI